MARIYPICSSSGANSTFIGTRGHGILVDAGCSFHMLKNLLELIDTRFDGIEAIFITHEHSDHIKALAQIIKHTKIPVFMSEKSAAAGAERGLIPEGVQFYNPRDGYKSAQFEVSCFDTSHDSADSVGYKVRFKDDWFGVCTDTGFITDDTEKALLGCKTVLIESNYDEDMLRRNPNYLADLKKRITGVRGHLSNPDCAAFAEKLVRSGTRNLILGHLSRENNTPATAVGCTRRHLEQCGFTEEKDFTICAAPVVTEGEYIAV